METIHKTIEQQMEWIELDCLQSKIDRQTMVFQSQSRYLRAYLIEALAVYLLSKSKCAKEPDGPYTRRIKGCCQMALNICESFGYLTETQCKHYEKILR